MRIIDGRTHGSPPCEGVDALYVAPEDSALYTQSVTGFHFFFGVRDSKTDVTSFLHSPTFEPDESSILTGVQAAALLITRYTSRR